MLKRIARRAVALVGGLDHRPLQRRVAARRAVTLVDWLDRRPFQCGMAALATGLAAAERPRTVAIAALGSAALFAALRRPRLAVTIGSALLFGASVGAARLDSLDSRMHAAHPGASLAGRGTPLEPPRTALLRT